MKTPSFLKGYEFLYRENPREACRQWFREARYGLFLHYGLYSILGRGECVQRDEKIRPADYAALADQFTAEEFNAEEIASLAVECGMRYINLTTRHCDSFCLFDTAETDFNSVRTPAGRDLVAELAAACDKNGLGLCLYYTHGRDWRHPHAPNPDRWGGVPRPAYDPPEPSYATGENHDLGIYLRFMENQIRELLTNYGPIASIWLDGIAVPMGDRSRTPFPQSPRDPGNARGWHVQELYDLIHSLQPQVLISYKQGLLGTEDYFAPEREPVAVAGRPLMEVCTTTCPSDLWGYVHDCADQPRSVEKVWNTMQHCAEADANLLLNIGPQGDGSLNPRDVELLQSVVKKLKNHGFSSPIKGITGHSGHHPATCS